MISIDPARARDDPVIVKNIPFYKAKKALEAEVMKLNPPARPQNWGVRNLSIYDLHISFFFFFVPIRQIEEEDAHPNVDSYELTFRALAGTGPSIECIFLEQGGSQRS